MEKILKFRNYLQMRVKNLFLLPLLLCSLTISSQITSYIPPTPSIAAFATYVSIPPANCSGIPDISYPLMTLPTKSKDVTFNFSLQYHPNNISLQHDATNVGLGWSLFGGGVISKSINDSPDEEHNERPDTEIHPYNDDYFYNFFGQSGRFIFKRQDRNSNLAANFKINTSKASTPKITFTNTAIKGVYITSFTITDGNGITYIFDKPDYITPLSYNAFHLTKIKDQAGNLIATLEYEKIIPLRPRFYNVYGDEYSHYLKKVNAVGIGSIDFTYSSDQSLRMTRNDMVQLNAMQMKNFRGEVVRKCKMEYSFTQHMPDFYDAIVMGNARFLKKLEFLDANDQPVEKYGFSYIHRPSIVSVNVNNFDDYGFTKYDYGTTSETGRNGVLEKVTLPTGGHIAYDFGANRIMSPYADNDFDFNTPRRDTFFDENLDFPSQTLSNTTIGSNSNYSTNTYAENGTLTSYGAGLRIDRIRYFDSSGALLPAQTITYDYRDFNNPEYESGQMIVEKKIRNVQAPMTLEAKIYYKNVKVTNGTGNGYTKYHYYTPYDTMKNGWFMATPFSQNIRFGWRSFSLLKEGIPKHIETYSSDNALLQRDSYYYSSEWLETNNWFLRWSDRSFFGEYTDYVHHTYKVTQKFSYAPNSVMTEKSITKYNKNNFLVDSESSFNTKNVQNRTKYYYPKDLPNEPLAAELITKNMIYKPLKTETFTNESARLSTERTIYKNWGNTFISPETMQSSKGNDAAETRVKILQIDTATGNPLEIENEDGTRTSYIWGYNGTLLVAKIENMPYANIPAGQIQSIQTLTNLSALGSNFESEEYNIRRALNLLQKNTALNSAMMTYYVHKPLVGVKSITDPMGKAIFYNYDAFGRLISVKDDKNNLISENKYRLRTQN